MRWILVAMFGLLQAGDLISTRLAIGTGGHERNPLMVHVVENLPVFIILKLSLVVLMLVLAARKDRIAFWIVAPVSIVSYTYIVTNNVLIYLG